MPAIEAIHPPAERLTAFAAGRLDGPEVDEIEQHLSSCESCCQLIRNPLEDSQVAAPVAEGEAVDERSSDLPVSSSFVALPAAAGAFEDQPTCADPSPYPPALAGLPHELNDHPRYRVVAAIGAGGMGAVYRAEHRLMDRPVALKVIRGDLLGSAALVERFRREVKSVARLASHPNIVAAYDAEQAGDTHMLVMEFVDGTDLARVVDRRGPLPVGEACEYARQAAVGLQHAFEEGMVHRDIKPQNLMRTTRGQIKILDFGLGRFASEIASQRGLTAEGMVLGSADYIAPEQIHNPQGADIQGDIYSLGCTLYFMLAGRPPFAGGSLMQKLQAHSEKPPRPLVEIRPDVPAELSRVVERMMAKSPALRPNTPAEVVLAFTPFADTDAFERYVEFPDLADRNTAVWDATKADSGSIAVERLLSDSALDPGRPRALSIGVERLSRLGRPAWRAVAGLLLLVFVVWGVVLRYRTANNGTIELVNLPKDAEVLVDGEEIAVTWPGGGKPAVVTVTAGKHRVMVKKDGIETSGEEVTVQAEGNETFTVRFVAPSKLTHELAKVYDLESIKNSIGMTLKLIPAGEFFMGSPEDAIEANDDEKPLHRVRITKPFYLGTCEVTQAQYDAVMGNNPSHFSATGGGKDRVARESTDGYPVENVSWLDAIQFCNKLSEKEGKKPFYETEGNFIQVPDWNGQGYRLPTEAEWEYACRANASTPARFSFGDNPLELGVYGWFKINADSRTHPVSQKRPNGFGLYDMHGNVFEWCWDWHIGEYYNQSPADDPTGAAVASNRVVRGGSWDYSPRICRSAVRLSNPPGGRYIDIGIRLALGRSGR
jgi:formylglycine-generating enzyme required for sulfatase activity